MTAGSSRRVGAWDVAFLVACAVVVPLLLVLGRSTTFWLDDWLILDGLTQEGSSVDALMRPHNDHWQLSLVVLWKLLLATVGLHSHLPYLLPIMVAHLAAAAAVYGLVRQQAGPFIAFAAGLVFLVLGTGGEVFFFAAAFNLVAATALGTWALLLFLHPDPHLPAGGRRAVVIAILLLAAVTSGGAGLAFLPVIVAVAVLVPGRRRDTWVVLPALLAFAAWQLTYGSGLARASALAGTGPARALGEYIRTGVGHSTGAVLGWEDEVGLIVAVLLTGATAWHLLGRRPLLVGAVAGAVGLVCAYGVTGLARSALGTEQATAARYVYTTAPFVLLLLSAWLGTLAPLEPRRLRVALTVAAFAAVALAANITQLRSWQVFFEDRAIETRAAIAVLLEHGGSPAIPGDRAPVGVPGLGVDHLPAADRLRDLVVQYGSPLDDPSWAAGGVTPAEVDAALVRLVGSQPWLTVAAAMPTERGVPEVVESSTVQLVADGSCLRLVPSGPAPTVTLRASNGQVIHVLTEHGGSLRAQLSRTGLSMPDAPTIDLPAHGVAAIQVPDLADEGTWLVRLEPPSIGAITVCASPR